jgi:hypothetical protein
MHVRQTRRGTTIRLSHAETTELLTALALTMAAYGVLQNFMTAGQKQLTYPSLLFVSRLGSAVWDALAVKPGQPPANASASPGSRPE